LTKFCSGTYEEEEDLVVDDGDVEEAFMINLDFLYGDAATVDDEDAATVFKSLVACFCITARFLLLKPNSDDDDVNPVGILLISREVLLLPDANEQLTDRRNTETTTDNTTAPEALGLGLLIVDRRLVGIRYGVCRLSRKRK
jgi:hypothetical protein